MPSPQSCVIVDSQRNYNICQGALGAHTKPLVYNQQSIRRIIQLEPQTPYKYTQMEKYRVVLVEDDTSILERLSTLVNDCEWLELDNACCRFQQGLAALLEHNIMIMILH